MVTELNESAGEISEFGSPELALWSLDREFHTMQHLLWSRTKNSRAKLHELIGVTYECGTKMSRDGRISGLCECADEHQTRVETTFDIVREQIVSGAFVPVDAEAIQRRIWLVFKKRSWSEGPNGERAARVSVGAVADPNSYGLERKAPKALSHRMPSRVHAEVLVLALSAGGSRRLSFHPRSRAFEAYLAERLTNRGFGDLEVNLDRIAGILSEVRDLANAQTGWVVPCCPDLGRLPWFEARVEHGLVEHIGPALASIEAKAEVDGPGWEPRTHGDLVEQQVIADETAGALEPNRRAGRGRSVLPEDEFLAALLGDYLSAIRTGARSVDAASIALRKNVDPVRLPLADAVVAGIAEDLEELAGDYDHDTGPR